MPEDDGTRGPHVRTAGFVPARLTTLFVDDAADLLVAAATLQDIGYSERIARTGCHPLNGAIFRQASGSLLGLPASSRMTPARWPVASAPIAVALGQ